MSVPSSALIHLHRVEQPATLRALDEAMREWKFIRQGVAALPPLPPLVKGGSALPLARGASEEGLPLLSKGTSGLPPLSKGGNEGGSPPPPPPLDSGPGHAAYLIGPRRGDWLTIIQAFEGVGRDDAPFLADLANRLSDRLRTHSLALLLLDDAVLFYNLDYRGTPRDGYSSNPLYLADGLTEAEILRQRHQPKACTPLLPRGTRIEQVGELLNAGWWAAHDGKRLDASGRPPAEEEIDEPGRLARLGRLLKLDGDAGYAFGHWRRLIDWHGFQAVYYAARGRALKLADSR